MLTWQDMELARHRINDRLRQAERDRLVQQALAGRPRKGPLYSRLLAWLGQWLINWGQRLYERYGEAPEAPTPLANQTR